MRLPFLLLPVLVALAPLSILANEHQHKHHEHKQSLAAHVHGLATLDIALEGQRLELHLNSPAMNIVGFEYQPNSAADKKTVADAERTLKNEQLLFKLSSDAQCALSSVNIENDLTAGHAEEHDHTTHDDKHDAEHQHSDIQVSYTFNCANPHKLKSIDLAGFFTAFPLTEKIHLQLITAQTQQGAQMSVSTPQLDW